MGAPHGSRRGLPHPTSLETGSYNAPARTFRIQSGGTGEHQRLVGGDAGHDPFGGGHSRVGERLRRVTGGVDAGHCRCLKHIRPNQRTNRPVIKRAPQLFGQWTRHPRRTDRNPVVLANMAATLEEASRGRLLLGLGAGNDADEHRSLGVPVDHRISRFEEALTIITGLLRDGQVDFAGE